MSETDEVSTYETSHIEFEPSTGYVGTALDSMPEPVTAMIISSYVSIQPDNRIIEGYWLKAHDESSITPEPQPIMHSFEFMQVSRVCAAIFASCGKSGLGEDRVGMGFTAYYNRLARSLDPSLPDGPIKNLGCYVAGYPDRGVMVRFMTVDGCPSPVAAVQGCLSPQGMHTMARGFRDMVEWRMIALEQAAALVAAQKSDKVAKVARAPETRRPIEAVTASSPRR